MRLKVFYRQRMCYRAWKIVPSYIPYAGTRRPCWMGIWARFGWRHVSIGLQFDPR